MSEHRFSGATYEAEHDQDRLSRQYDHVWILMRDGEWRTLSEIAALLDYPEASISARLRDMRKKRFGAHTVNRRSRGDREHGLFEYQLVINTTGELSEGADDGEEADEHID